MRFQKYRQDRSEATPACGLCGGGLDSDTELLGGLCERCGRDQYDDSDGERWVHGLVTDRDRDRADRIQHNK